MGKGANQMNPYSPDDTDAFNRTPAADVAPGSDASDTLGDNDVLELSGTSGSYGETPTEGDDYTYNSAVALGDNIDANGGRAAVQTSDESGATTGAGYSFGSAADATDTAGDAGTDEDTEAIRADIEQTRTQMSATIDAIQERLNPQT